MAGWIDQNGNMHGFEHSNGYPMWSSVNYLHNIAKGTVTGKTYWSWTGLNKDIGTTEEVLAIQGGDYYWLPEAQKLKVVSTSEDDDGIGTAGAGAYQMLIQGLDANYDIQTELVDLNGTTIVTTAKDWLRVNLVYLTTGAAINVGVVTVKDNSSTYTLTQIAAGDGGAQSGVYTVPRNNQYVMIGGEASSSSQKGSTLRVMIRPFGFVFRNVYNVSLFASAHNIEPSLPYILPGKSDVMLTSIAAASGDSVSAAVYGFYEST